MDTDTRLLLELRLSAILGGALLVYVLADVALTVAGVLPGDGSAAVDAVAAVVAAAALLNAWRMARARRGHGISQITFAEAILVLGLAFVCGIVLLGALR